MESIGAVTVDWDTPAAPEAGVNLRPALMPERARGLTLGSALLMALRAEAC
jgi:hypothetical protein